MLILNYRVNVTQLKMSKMKAIFYLASVLILGAMLSCGKSTNSTVTSGNIKEKVETKNAITYKSFVGSGISSFKGILVMGSGNDENNPTAGILDESTDVELLTWSAFLYFP